MRAARRGWLATASRPSAVGLALVLVGVLSAALVAAPDAGALPLRRREAGVSGAWSWFGDPRAVYYQGAHRRTYVGWIDHAGSIQVGSYDHDTGVRVTATLKQNFQIDDHNNPSLLLRPDGHLIAFWSAHIGGRMYYRRTVGPEDVTAWEPERFVPTNSEGPWGYTYPNPVQLSAEGNRIWLFWRGGNFNPTFSTSDDEATWTPARTLISVPDQRPYVKYASNGGDTIHFAFTQAHPRNVATDIYYARYRAGRIERASGAQIEPLSQAPIVPSQADRIYTAALHHGQRAWVHDVAADAAGRPVVTYASFVSTSDHRYHYSRWTGTRWEDHEIARAGGSMSVDPVDHRRLGARQLPAGLPARQRRPGPERDLDARRLPELHHLPDGGRRRGAQPRRLQPRQRLVGARPAGHGRLRRRRRADPQVLLHWLVGLVEPAARSRRPRAELAGAGLAGARAARRLRHRRGHRPPAPRQLRRRGVERLDRPRRGAWRPPGRLARRGLRRARAARRDRARRRQRSGGALEAGRDLAGALAGGAEPGWGLGAERRLLGAGTARRLHRRRQRGARAPVPLQPLEPLGAPGPRPGRRPLRQPGRGDRMGTTPPGRVRHHHRPPGAGAPLVRRRRVGRLERTGVPRDRRRPLGGGRHGGDLLGPAPPRRLHLGVLRARPAALLVQRALERPGVAALRRPADRRPGGRQPARLPDPAQPPRPPAGRGLGSGCKHITANLPLGTADPAAATRGPTGIPAKDPMGGSGGSCLGLPPIQSRPT